MVFDCILNDCQIIAVEDKKFKDKESGKDINWSQVVFVQGTKVNTMSADSKVSPKLVHGSTVDLVVSVSEQFIKGGGKINKFKIVDFQEVPFDK